LRFVELPRGTEAERTQTLGRMRAIYNDCYGLLPDEAFTAYAEGNMKPLREALRKGGFLYPFEYICADLKRDLNEKNYFAHGLEDPDTGTLIAYSTGYYPLHPDGLWGIRE